jgi:hypothetical protein
VFTAAISLLLLLQATFLLLAVAGATVTVSWSVAPDTIFIVFLLSVIPVTGQQFHCG